jgi:hypothetical protein
MAGETIMAGTIVADDIQHSTAGSVGTEYVVNGSAKAWHSIDGDAGTPVFFDSFNCASITDTATGKPQVNFTNSLSNDDFAVSALSGENGGASLSFGSNTPKTTSSVIYKTMNSAFGNTDTTNLDGIIMGDLA